jgi:hypothetical protein
MRESVSREKWRIFDVIGDVSKISDEGIDDLLVVGWHKIKFVQLTPYGIHLAIVRTFLEHLRLSVNVHGLYTDIPRI